MNIALITTGLKAFAAFWSLLFFVLSAAMIGRFNAGFGSYFSGSGFSEGNACLAASIFDLLYFAVVIVFLFLRPTNIFISVLVDTIILGFLFILNLGSVAALTQGAAYFRSRTCRVGFETAFCGLATGVLVVGWILVFLILGVLILEVFITLRSYGGGLDTWKTPFNELVTNGTPSRGIGHTGHGVGHKTEAPVGTVGQPTVVQNQPQVVQNV